MDPQSLCELTATEAARLIREGAITSQELVGACLARIGERDAEVEAWAFLDPEHAMVQAYAADQWRLSGRPTGPLHGIPVGVKDIIDTGDMPTENGSALYAGRTPSRDAAAVGKLRAAGAVILGKTVTTELATYTPGKTRNPHNAAHTPGGSSSGSAAAVAAGMVPLALGSQTNGSVIRPAAFCGVYGFKPTRGLIPRTGVLRTSRSLDQLGVFGRDIPDVALMAEQLTGHDEGDPDTGPRAHMPLAAVAAEEPPLPPVFAVVKTPYWERAEAETREAFAELAAHLGAQAEEVELFPSAVDAWVWHRTIMEAEMVHCLRREFEQGREHLSEPLQAQLARGRQVPALDYQAALARVDPLHETFVELFEQRYDAILTPAAPGVAPKGLDSTGDPVFCTLWTLCGMPAVSVPLMQGGEGLPLGVQLVGPRYGDARLLRTARWLVESVRGR
jgi:Asp-tRNA(Asn)/Glu-tRNA(Gln) amidotransferase A subunit family amidase